MATQNPVRNRRAQQAPLASEASEEVLQELEQQLNSSGKASCGDVGGWRAWAWGVGHILL